jgi:hypothetical protein
MESQSGRAHFALIPDEIQVGPAGVGVRIPLCTLSIEWRAIAWQGVPFTDVYSQSCGGGYPLPSRVRWWLPIKAAGAPQVVAICAGHCGHPPPLLLT